MFGETEVFASTSEAMAAFFEKLGQHSYYKFASGLAVPYKKEMFIDLSQDRTAESIINVYGGDATAYLRYDAALVEIGGTHVMARVVCRDNGYSVRFGITDKELRSGLLVTLMSRANIEEEPNTKE